MEVEQKNTVLISVKECEKRIHFIEESISKISGKIHWLC